MAVASERVYLAGEQLPLSLSSLESTSCSGQVSGGGGNLVLGPGIHLHGERLFATKAGRLLHNSKRNSCWIDSHGKRYTAVKGDRVLGTVTNRLTDGWRLDIGCAEPAFVSALSFEGSTRKNRPNIKVGDLLYCQLLIATKHMEPEVVCMDSEAKARGMGALSAGGMLLHVPLRSCALLLSDRCDLLKRLGKELKFEVVVGMNGRLWVNSQSVRQTTLLGAALCQDIDQMDSAALLALANTTIQQIKGI